MLAPGGFGRRRYDWLKFGDGATLEPAVLVAVVWTTVPGYTVERERGGRRLWRRATDKEGADPNRKNNAATTPRCVLHAAGADPDQFPVDFPD